MMQLKNLSIQIVDLSYYINITSVCSNLNNIVSAFYFFIYSIMITLFVGLPSHRYIYQTNILCIWTRFRDDESKAYEHTLLFTKWAMRDSNLCDIMLFKIYTWRFQFGSILFIGNSSSISMFTKSLCAKLLNAREAMMMMTIQRKSTWWDCKMMILSGTLLNWIIKELIIRTKNWESKPLRSLICQYTHKLECSFFVSNVPLKFIFVDL